MGFWFVFSWWLGILKIFLHASWPSDCLFFFLILVSSSWLFYPILEAAFNCFFYCKIFGLMLSCVFFPPRCVALRLLWRLDFKITPILGDHGFRHGSLESILSLIFVNDVKWKSAFICFYFWFFPRTIREETVFSLLSITHSLFKYYLIIFAWLISRFCYILWLCYFYNWAWN